MKVWFKSRVAVTRRAVIQGASLSLAAATAVGGLAWAGSERAPWGTPGGDKAADTVAVAGATGDAAITTQVVSSTETGFALTKDGGVYEFRGSWQRIGEGKSALYAIDCSQTPGEVQGTKKMRDAVKSALKTPLCSVDDVQEERLNNVFATSADGKIHKYTGRTDRGVGEWSLIGDGGAEFATGHGQLYRLSGDRKVVSRWTGRFNEWETVGGEAQRIYAGGAGLFATSFDGGNLWRYDFKPEHWTKVGGPGAEFVVGRDFVAGLAPDKSQIWMANHKGEKWRRVSGPAQRIYGGTAGLFRIDDGTGNISEWKKSKKRWAVVGGPGYQFAVGKRVFGVSPNQREIWFTDDPGEWRNTGSGFLSPQDKVRRLDEIMRPGGFDDFHKLRDTRWSQHDVYGFTWANNGCNYIGGATRFAGLPDFTPACVRHDFGYKNYKEALGVDGWRDGVPGVTNGSPKKHIDRVFLEDMIAMCDTGRAKAPAGMGCATAAKLMYEAVNRMGS
ncbi:phospholipase A2 [Streptomyces sp. NPDC050848]|uniref:phospholipase A2 n=1 Tax=Streptomyces sp. NPDC050848 TaxID=3155791 RepID=UPI0033FF3A5D